ncbi:hypothetical protein [Undibacterium curvum]|uniref:hypothetical protein n=1 Tax=Undibacterium curvum TaxID=2762294 RepID=UPI003D11DC85
MTPANYRILFKTHLALVVIIFLFFGSISIFFQDNLTPSGKIVIPIEFVFFTLLHGTIAYGNKKESNKARIASRVCGFLLFPFFPIGTVFGIFLLENSKLRPLEQNNADSERPTKQA